MLQLLLSALIVAACAVHVLWTLLPQTARRRVLQALRRLPLPGALDAALQRRLQTQRSQAVRWMPRKKPPTFRNRR